MDERIDLKKQGKLKSNITRFRQDKRLAVTGLIHSLALLGMLGCVVFGIFRYQDDLSLENIQRMMSYVKAAGTTADPFTEYRFEAGLETVYAPFGAGLAVSSGDTYSFISGLGNSKYSIQLHYNDPALCTSEKYVLIYDRGGKGFCVANSYAEYLNTALESPILTASMNREGAFALVTDEAGARSAVSVYSKKQELLCQWITNQYYVLSASVNPDSDRFAVLALGQESEGLALVTRILCFEIGQEKASWVVDLGQRQVYSMTHDKSGGLVILCDDGAHRYEDGHRTAFVPFDTPVRLFAVSESGEVLVSFDQTDRSSRTAGALVLGDRLKTLWQGSFSGTPRAVDCRGGSAALLFTDRLEVIGYAEDTPQTDTLPQSGARDLVVDEEGSPILIYSDRAEKLRTELEETQ